MKESNKIKKYKWIKRTILLDKHIQDDIDKTISNYTTYLRNKGMKEKTIKEYTRIANGLLMLSQKSLDKLNPDDLENYIETHYTQRSDNKTYIMMILSILRKFLRYSGQETLANNIFYPSDTPYKTVIRGYNLTDEMEIYFNETWNNYNKRFTAFGRSPNTSVSYKIALRTYLCAINKTIEESTEEDIIKWITFLKDRINDNTLNLYRRILKIFFKYFDKEDIFKNIPPITQYKPPTKRIPFNIIEYVLIHSKADTQYPWAYPFLITMTFTGIRISALCKLQTENIDFNSNTITLYETKGNKGRNIPLNVKFVKPSLLDYIQKHNITHGYLFYNKQGNPIKPPNVRNYLHKFRKHTHGLAPHDFRRAITQELMRLSNYNIYFVSKFLGHSDVHVTERYIGDSYDEIQQMYNKYTETINLHI